jgi:hypothetical protein
MGAITANNSSSFTLFEVEVTAKGGELGEA